MTDAAKDRKSRDFSRMVYALYAASLLSFATDTMISLIGLAAGTMLALLMGRLVHSTRRAGYKQTDRTSALTIAMVDRPLASAFPP